MNKITVYGRLTTDVEIREVNGRSVANFGLAGNTKRKDKDGKIIANFYRVGIWGPAADSASKYLHKGNRVAVAGDLIFREYVGRDQQNHYAMEIENAEFDLVETRGETGGATATPASAPTAPLSGGDDELPF